MSTNGQKQIFGPFFNGGTLVSGPKVYHYEAGSVGFTSPKSIWQDRSKSIELLNPYQGDANGLIEFFGDGLYKLIIARPTSTGPTDQVLYTWDNFSILDTIQSVFEEGDVVTAASTITVGPGIWTHIIGTQPIGQMNGDPPFQWLVFDADVVMNHSANLILPGAINRTFKTGDVAFFLNDSSNVWRLAMHFQGAEGMYDGRQGSSYAATATLAVPGDGDYVDIGGADVEITGIAAKPAGYHFTARFTGSGVQFIHSATLLCPYSADYRIVTNELIEFRSLGSGVWIMAFRSGPAVAPAVIQPIFNSALHDGFLHPIGTAIVCSRYRSLSTLCIPAAVTLGYTGTSLGTATFDNATETWTSVAHTLIDGDIVHLSNAGGGLPSGYTAATVYYVVSATADTFKLALTRGGVAVNGTTNGTGTHTVHNKCQLPDMRGRAIVPLDNLGGVAASVITSASSNGANATILGGKFGTQTIAGGSTGFHPGLEADEWNQSNTPPSMAVGAQIRW